MKNDIKNFNKMGEAKEYCVNHFNNSNTTFHGVWYCVTVNSSRTYIHIQGLNGQKGIVTETKKQHPGKGILCKKLFKGIL